MDLLDGFYKDGWIPDRDFPWRVVLDSDCDNEVDDPFAIAHALLSPGEMSVEVLSAAHFCNDRAATPEEGMEQSFRALEQLTEVMSIDKLPSIVRGATGPMEDDTHPRESDASKAIVERALASDDPLLVVSIGAATNVASAILAEPNIVERMIVVWLGGHCFDWPDALEFNLMGDPVAASLLFDCGVRLILVPALGVSSHMLVSQAQLERELAGSALGRYLAEMVAAQYGDRGPGYSKEIWDMAATAWAIDPRWVPTRLVSSPELGADLRLREGPARHPIRYAYWCARNAIFQDLFAKVLQVQAG